MRPDQIHQQSRSTAPRRWGVVAPVPVLAALVLSGFVLPSGSSQGIQPPSLARVESEELRLRDASEGDDPRAAWNDFLARRVPPGETLTSFPLTARYLAAWKAMRRLPR